MLKKLSKFKKGCLVGTFVVSASIALLISPTGAKANDNATQSLIENRQVINSNYVVNKGTTNKATISGDVSKEAQGNIGINVGAGDFITQNNIAAISVSKTQTELVSSTISSHQIATLNEINNDLIDSTTNTASATGNVLSNAKGNISLNVAAGNVIAQTNLLSIASGTASSGLAEAHIKQNIGAGVITFEGDFDISAGYGYYYGYGYGGYYSGDYEINDMWNIDEIYYYYSYEEGDTYKEVEYEYDKYVEEGSWTETGEYGEYYGEGEIGYLGIEVDLSGEFSGVIPLLSGGNTVTNTCTTNTASLSGNVLSGATGNIGVNVAAGSNILQANALSVAVH